MKKGIKKYVGGVPELMTPRMASVKTADVPLVSGTPKQVSTGPSFIDKTGDSMKGMDIGGMASQLGGSLAMLINANKKQDPTGKPYKKGSNMIKYQIGTQGTKVKKSESKVQKNINFILNANAANAKEKAKLNNRVAPKKLEGKQPKLELDTNKSNPIKYQEGNEYAQASKLQKNAYDEVNSPRAAVAEPIAPRRSNIKLSQDLPANPAPKMMQNTEGSMDDNKNMLPQDLLSKKDRMISRLPKFIQSAVAGKAKSRIDRFEKDYNSAKNELGYKDNLSEMDENRITRKIVNNRKERVSDAESEEMAKRGGYTAKGYPDTFKRTKGKMGSSIGFGDEYGPGKKEYIGQLRENKKKDLQARLAGREGMEQEYNNEIAAKNAIASGIPSSLTSPTPTFSKESIQRNIEKQAGGPVSTEKNPILYKEEPQKETKQSTQGTKQSNPYIAFKNMSAADQKTYRAGMAGNKDFEVDGRTYKAPTSKQKMRSERMQKLYEKNPAMYNKLITKTSSFKEGTSSLKAENPRKVLKGKNGAPDTLYNTKTGRKQPFISGDAKEEKPAKKQETVTPKPVVKTEAKKETKENKGLYQGSTLSELIGTAGIPALSELIGPNPKNKFGKMAKAVVKTGPAVVRFVHDAIADKKNKGSVDWVARGGNFAKDIGIGTAATGTVRTARGTRKSYKEQESAAAKETENPIAPSRKEALKKGANEAVDKATVTKLPKKIINYVKDVTGNSPQGKQAKMNVKNANAHKAATDPNAKVKFTGKGNGTMGREGEYYREGKVVSQKEYDAGTLSDQKQKVGKRKSSLKASSKEVGNIRFKEKSKKYTNELEERSKLEKESYISQGSNIQGPNLPKTNPVKDETAIRRRNAEETEKMREKGFSDKEGRTPSEFTNWYTQEKNRISSQPIPSKKKPDDKEYTQEEWNAEKERQLVEHSKTKDAYKKAVDDNKKLVAEKEKAAKEKPAVETKPETKVETTAEPTTKKRASRSGATTQEVNDLTNNKRETPAETTQKTKGKKGTQSTESGPNDGPTMTAADIGVTGKKKKGANSKANGARLIKYK